MKTLLIIIGNLIAFLIVVSAARAQETTGYIYGTVTTYNNSYTGQIRWGTEEAFWNDFFNAQKMGDEYYESILKKSGDNKKEESEWAINSWNPSSIWENRKYTRHEFTTQFGNINSIEPRGKDRVRLVLKNGERIELDGSGYNDVGAKITIFDPELGDVKLEWSRIDKIEFQEAPENHIPSGGGPIYGTIETFKGSYTGFVQWDHDERLGNDVLDGDSRDGRVSIAFKHIKSIESEGNACFVTLHSGRNFTLRGTNDVNSQNDGIIVTVPEIGEIDIPWKVFDRAEFIKTEDTRDAYMKYQSPKGLSGTVETYRGDKFSGRLVYDVDEAWEVETLEAKDGDVEYRIPFAKIKSISPKNAYYSVIEIRNGDKLLLGEGRDVSSDNDGIIIFPSSGGEPVLIKWREVSEVVFD